MMRNIDDMKIEIQTSFNWQIYRRKKNKTLK